MKSRGIRRLGEMWAGESDPKMGSMMKTLSLHDRMRLAVEAYVILKTVDRWLRGGPVRPSTAERLERAAKTLGIEVKREAA